MKFTEAQRGELATLAAHVEAAPHGAASRIVAECAKVHGKSPATVWRWLREFRGRRRKVRSDAGTTRHDEAELEQVMIVKEQTRRKDARLNREWVGSTEKAIEVAVAEGRIAGPISRSAVSRWARRNGLGRDAAKKIHRPKRARQVNDVHCIDASQTKLLRIVGEDENGEPLIGVRPAEGYIRNRTKEPESLWLVGIVDDHSSVFWGEYRVAVGESYEVVLDVLRAPWCGDPRCAVRGLPRVLNADKGPFVTKGANNGFFKGLGIDLLDRNPDSPDVSGKIEPRWADVWTGFEVWFARTPDRVLSLTDLNREFEVFFSERNSRRHTWERGRTREEIYRTGLAEIELRTMPEAAGSWTWRQKVRRVDAYGCVRIENQVFRVDDSLVKKWVEIIVTAEGEMICRETLTGETFDMVLVTPEDVTDWTEFDPRHDTPLQRLAKAAAADDGPRSNAWAADEDGARVVAFTPPAREVEPETPLTRHEAAKRYTNLDEALADARNVLGVEVILANPGIMDLLKTRIAQHDLDKTRCREEFLELAASAG